MSQVGITALKKYYLQESGANFFQIKKVMREFSIMRYFHLTGSTREIFIEILNIMKSIKLVKFDHHKVSDGDLVVAEGHSDNVPFSIARVFNTRADKGCTRGRHAHRECTQLLICTNGTIKVICDDGKQTSTHILDKANYGLLIEPGIWSEQRYMEENTVLTVLCNLPYDASDYIRDRENFLKYKGVK
jgi:hypothetical protein